MQLNQTKPALNQTNYLRIYYNMQIFSCTGARVYRKAINEWGSMFTGVGLLIVIANQF